MKVYSINIRDIELETLQQYIERCDVKRQEAVQKYKFEQDKKRGIVAGLLLRYAYFSWQKERGRTSLKEVRLGYSMDGKPYMEEEQNFCFSLSHAGEYVLLAYDMHPVGVDVEQIIKKDNALKLAKRFFTEEEHQALCALNDGDERNRQFTRIWTQKESYLKYLGIGLRYGMNTFYKDTEDRIIDYKTHLHQVVKIKEFTQIEGYCISVCFVCEENINAEDAFVIEQINEKMLLER